MYAAKYLPTLFPSFRHRAIHEPVPSDMAGVVY